MTESACGCAALANAADADRPTRFTFVEVRYDLRQIFVVTATTDGAAINRVAEAHRRGPDAMRPMLGAETGVYIGAGIAREAKVCQLAISPRASYRGVPIHGPF